MEDIDRAGEVIVTGEPACIGSQFCIADERCNTAPVAIINAAQAADSDEPSGPQCGFTVGSLIQDD